MAHTGDGKTAFARQIAEATAKAGGKVLWFCGEDPEEATAERYLADGTNISATDMGRLALTDSELNKIDKAALISASWAKNIKVVFEAPSVEEVLITIDEQDSLDLGIYDYAQIFGDSVSLEGEIAKLAIGLSARSKDRRLANLLLSQVTNDVIRRGREEFIKHKNVQGFIPGLGDTEWCRRAEKYCKAVWSIFRPGRWQRMMGQDTEDNCAELHICKANFGPQGFVELNWEGERTRFKDTI